MYVFWRIRCFRPAEKKLFDRTFFSQTDELDPVTKHNVERSLGHERSTKRDILAYRSLFREASGHSLGIASSQFTLISLPDYFEDDRGQEIPASQVAALTRS